MFTFFEPEDEYKTDKSLHRNTKTKINFLIILFLIFGFLIISVQQDMIKFFKETPIKETCYFENIYTIRINDEEIEKVKIKKALNDHLGILESLKGYQGAEIKLSSDLNQTKKYAIYIFFKKNSSDIKRIPETLCGHKVVIEEK